jgi:broad specificity phosphatase PhoE
MSDGDSAAPAGPLIRLFLARHGRTRLNAAGVLRGHLDPPLDSIGRFQALVLADVLAHQGLVSIVSSPLLRARETAEPIGLRTGLPVEIDERLIDRDYGCWAGRSKDEVIARWGSLDDAPEIEPTKSVVDRTMAALTEVCDRFSDGTVLVVSHDAVNSSVLPILDARLDDIGTVPQDTGCFNVIERSGAHWSVRSVNNAPAGHDL